MNKKIITQQLSASILWVLSICIVAIALTSVAQARNQLTDISFASIPGNKVQVVLKFNESAPQPNVFTINSPARIALDLPETDLVLAKKRQNIGIGLVNNIVSVSSGDRSRVVLSLTSLTSYKTQVDGKNIIITLNESASGAPIESAPESNVAKAQTTSVKNTTTKSSPKTVQKKSSKAYSSKPYIKDVDFRLGGDNSGNIILTFSKQPTSVNLKQESDKLILEINGMKLPEELERRLDVKDFATPVDFIDTFRSGKKVKMVVDTNGEFEHMGYQTGLAYTIEVKGLTIEEKQALKKKKFGYSGERLSLNFQDIEIRAVLQLIADFTGMNMVTSDSVNGSITLRLKNVPWDQALDIILKTKGLGMVEEGNVMRVAPAAELAAIAKQELAANKQIEELSPLVTETIQLQFVPATKISDLLDDLAGEGSNNNNNNNNRSSQPGSTGASYSNKRVSLVADDRTNKIIVRAPEFRLEQIKNLIAEVDTPTKQVLIDARVVVASNTFSKDIGLNWSVGSTKVGSTTGGNTTGEVDLGNAQKNVLGLAFALLNSSYLVDLEISASQLEGTAELISSPRVVTTNGGTATIESGKQIPYKSISDQGATTDFEDATLSLTVTPLIIPGNKVNMDLLITKDSVDNSTNTDGAGPAINTNSITTTVLVDNGDTVVLGGIFEHERTQGTDSVPVLGDIPVIGQAFRVNSTSDTKTELIIFITPKVMSETLSVR